MNPAVPDAKHASVAHGPERIPEEPGRRRALLPGLLLAAGLVALATPAAAYVGPGAGFALLSSFLVLLTTIVLAMLSLLVLPFRFLWRLIRRRRKVKPVIRRFVVVGLDGQDPKITDRLMAEGKLPNFQKLAEEGGYRPLATTFPSVSPVAWSSFSTGTSPAKHNIFDFLDRDPKTYLPRLSSAKIGSVEKFLKLGRFRIPLKKPELRLLRKSKPFWSILGEHEIWSTVLRVPITFPPDEFYGAELSAMSVPDLLGTQGTFLLFTTRPASAEFKEGGMRVPVERDGDRVEARLEGPPNLFVAGEPPMAIPLVAELDRGAGRVHLSVGGERLELEPGKLSDWVALTFRAAPGIKVRGIARMMVTEMDEHFSLYVTPVAIDPEKPAMPISHPGYYATYLAKRIGPYSTLGLAEDTWALNEEVIDDATFLELSYDIDRERQDMFFAALDRLRRGALVCVFDATDRIQHMFWRYTEDGHPADDGRESPHRNAIEELYHHNDELVGKVMERLDEDDVLIVCSDHGFSSFRRGINLNAWLLREGYLHLKEGADGTAEWLRDVDWSKTKAYALGLTGMFLNVRGREAEGIVEPGEEAEALKTELVRKLSGLKDEAKGEVGIREAFDTAKLYKGPYQRNAPDLLIGYNAGYRISWDGATGVVAGPVFEDNTKAWSGDHCIDPRLVPGVIFSNRPIEAEDPALIDVAPSALELFDVDVPAHMEGKALFDRRSFQAGRARPRRAAKAALSIALAAILAALATVSTGCGRDSEAAAPDKRVIVLGIDGMDHALTEKLMAEGRLPNFQRLAEEGGFQALDTAVPPLSPVAWSDFITGMDAGGHGIFDFLHRDPETIIPFFSTTRTSSEEPILTLGKWQIPGSGDIELLRQGEPFWRVLEDRGVPTAILRMPANFPPSGEASWELSGMGTTDIRGTPGMFSFYTSELFAFSGQDLSGGDVYEVDAFDNVVHASLYGPDNPFLTEPEKVEAPFTVYLDPKEDVAKLVLGDEERILKLGEWSDWVPFELPLVPTQSVPAMARFYLKQVRPEFEMYVSPLNIDPFAPAMPVSHPPGFAAELAHHTGRFYTQGMPEDTKALSDGVFDREEFLAQAEISAREIIDQYPYALERFDQGLLFYYFGHIDQVSHMMWRSLDPEHPAYDPEVDGAYADVIPSLYEGMDRLVGYTLDRIDAEGGPDTTLVVMSDHGFLSWRRSMHLNSWLRDQGYLAVKDPDLTSDPGLYANVDWSRTKAYGLGLNGLYVNLQGREKNGIVPPAEREELMRRIARDLLDAVDPETGRPPVSKVYLREEAYDDRGHLEIGPDIQVGYARYYHVANESSLGELTPEVYSDNTEPWSGDHGNDHELVPGVLFTNRSLAKPAVSLEELAEAILAEFGVERFPAAEERTKPGDPVKAMER